MVTVEIFDTSNIRSNNDNNNNNRYSKSYKNNNYFIQIVEGHFIPFQPSERRKW